MSGGNYSRAELSTELGIIKLRYFSATGSRHINNHISNIPYSNTARVCVVDIKSMESLTH